MYPILLQTYCTDRRSQLPCSQIISSFPPPCFLFRTGSSDPPAPHTRTHTHAHTHAPIQFATASKASSSTSMASYMANNCKVRAAAQIRSKASKGCITPLPALAIRYLNTGLDLPLPKCLTGRRANGNLLEMQLAGNATK